MNKIPKFTDNGVEYIDLDTLEQKISSINENRLYHFTSFDNFIKIWLSKSLLFSKREGMNVDDFMSLINVKFDSELDDINGIFKKANTILNQIPTNREEFTIKNRLFNKEIPNNLINDKLSIKAFKLNKNERRIYLWKQIL